MNKLLRESKVNKTDFTYIGLMFNSVDRVMRRYTLGEQKYARANWRNCDDPLTYEQSAVRHLMQYLNGQTDEDHLAASAANILILMDLEQSHGNRKRIVITGNSGVEYRIPVRIVPPAPNKTLGRRILSRRSANRKTLGELRNSSVSKSS